MPPAPPVPPPMLLEIYNRTSLEGRHLLVEEELFTLGRSPHCTLAIDDIRLSSLHFTIRAKGGHAFLWDRSTNGTFINGLLVPKREWFRLTGGDIISPVTNLHRHEPSTLSDQQAELIIAAIIFKRHVNDSQSPRKAAQSAQHIEAAHMQLPSSPPPSAALRPSRPADVTPTATSADATTRPAQAAAAAAAAVPPSPPQPRPSAAPAPAALPPPTRDAFDLPPASDIKVWRRKRPRDGSRAAGAPPAAAAAKVAVVRVGDGAGEEQPHQAAKAPRRSSRGGRGGAIAVGLTPPLPSSPSSRRGGKAPAGRMLSPMREGSTCTSRARRGAGASSGARVSAAHPSSPADGVASASGGRPMRAGATTLRDVFTFLVTSKADAEVEAADRA